MGCCLFGRRMMHEHVMTNLYRMLWWVLYLFQAVSVEIYQHVPSDTPSPVRGVAMPYHLMTGHPRYLWSVWQLARTLHPPSHSLCLSIIPYFRFNYDNSLIAMSLATILTGISTPHLAKFNFFTLLIIWDLISRLIKQSLEYQLDGLAASF